MTPEEEPKYAEFSMLESGGNHQSPSETDRLLDDRHHLQPSNNNIDIDIENNHRQRQLHRRLWCQATFLNLGCALVLSAQIILTPIYSSIYGDGLGVALPAIYTGSGIFGSIASNVPLNKLGYRRTMIWTGCLYTCAMLSNYYPIWQTLLPFAALGGFVVAIFILSVRTSLGRLAKTFSTTFGMDSDRIHSRMFVFHVLFLKAIVILGNLGSSLILKKSQVTIMIDSEIVDPINYLIYTNESTSSVVAAKNYLDICGVDYCNQDLGSSFDMNRPKVDVESAATAPDSEQFYTLVSLVVITCVVGVIIMWYLVMDSKDDGLTAIETMRKDNGKKSPSVMKLLMSSFIQLKDPKLLLLLPLAVSQPCGDTFWVADFNKAFVTCASGIQYVGYVAMWSGISGAISCFLFGWFNKNSIRSIPITVATIAHLFALIAIFNWKPQANNLPEMSAITAIWFLGSGVKLSLVPALFGVVFSDNMEVAYSNLNLWTFIGSMTMYSWSHFLCMDVKLYIMFVLLVASYIGYVTVEVIIHFQKKNEKSASVTTTSQDPRVNSTKNYFIVESVGQPS